MTTNPDDWTKELEADLARLASDMWGTQQRLAEKGFRVEGGNKSPSGWRLTGTIATRAAIRVQSDGTAEGQMPVLACWWYKPVVSIRLAGQGSYSDLTGISCTPLRIPHGAPVKSTSRLTVLFRPGRSLAGRSGREARSGRRLGRQAIGARPDNPTSFQGVAARA